LPQSGTLAQGGSGIMTLTAVIADLVTIPGIDVTYYFSTSSVGATVAFQ
jgi:hypothetical protein